MSEYEEYTPKELNMLSYVKQTKDQQRLDEGVTFAWFAEYFHRVKKLPPLDKALEDLRPKEKKVMTDDAMLDVVKMLNAKFGGTVEEGNEMAEQE